MSTQIRTFNVRTSPENIIVGSVGDKFFRTGSVYYLAGNSDSSLVRLEYNNDTFLREYKNPFYNNSIVQFEFSKEIWEKKSGTKTKSGWKFMSGEVDPYVRTENEIFYVTPTPTPSITPTPTTTPTPSVTPTPTPTVTPTPTITPSTTPIPVFPGLPLRARWTPSSMTSSAASFTWDDVSGNGYSVVKNSGNIPTTASGRYGLPAVVAPGNAIDARIPVPAYIMDGLSTFAAFCVLKTGDSHVGLSSFYGSARFAGSGTNIFSLEYFSAETTSSLQHRMDTTGTNDNAPKTVPTQTSSWYYYYVEYDGSQASSSLNGVFGGNFYTHTGTTKTAGGTAFYLLGTNYNGFFMDGQMHELAFFSASLTAQQRTDLFAYAASTYGI